MNFVVGNPRPGYLICAHLLSIGHASQRESLLAGFWWNAICMLAEVLPGDGRYAGA